MSIKEKLTLARQYLDEPHKFADSVVHRLRSNEVEMQLQPLCEVLDCILLGQGAYGMVFALSERVVLKVARDPNFEAFINYAQSKNGSNPYLPRVYYRTRVGSNQLYIMERLTSLATDYGDVSSPVDWHNHFICHFDQVIALRKQGAPVDFTCPKLKELVDEFGPENFNDICAKNMMLRGEQLVFTDPCCGYSGGKYASRRS